MNITKIVTTLSKVVNDPLQTISDKVVAFIVNLIVPFSVPKEVIAAFKRPLMGLVVTLAIFALFMITIVGTIFMSPLLLGSSILDSIASASQNTSNFASDTSFAETTVPKNNPFGGVGMAYSTVTSYFLDPAYYLQFGRNHPGIDMVPSQEYYDNSKTYKETHQVVIFATINGSVRQYVDQYGGETVEITNPENTFKVLYIHFSRILADSGTAVKAGMPVGIMGDTGFSTGDHVHYEIQIKDGSTWRSVNPLNYIQ
jgi:murein DD-endopeptidase MepM/ murein hydrolase activator NlpD